MNKNLFISILGVVAAMALLAGSANAQPQSAVAELKNAAGQVVGSATFTQQAGGVRIVVKSTALPAGMHGAHIHAVGKCEGPDFTTAGAHFNPEGKQHGAQNPSGPHAGDLPNLDVAANGTGTLDTTNARVTLGSGANSLFDADGSALVIHANPDDEKTDPTGNSGGRIACGLIVAGALPKTGQAAPALRHAQDGALPLLALAALMAAGAFALRRAAHRV